MSSCEIYYVEMKCRRMTSNGSPSFFVSGVHYKALNDPQAGPGRA
jgi:hypothetical protein